MLSECWETASRPRFCPTAGESSQRSPCKKVVWGEGQRRGELDTEIMQPLGPRKLRSFPPLTLGGEVTPLLASDTFAGGFGEWDKERAVTPIVSIGGKPQGNGP